MKIKIQDRLDEILKIGKPSTYLEVKTIIIEEYGESAFESCKKDVQMKLRDKSKAPKTNSSSGASSLEKQMFKKQRSDSVFSFQPSSESRKSIKLSPSQISAVSEAARRASTRRESLESKIRPVSTQSGEYSDSPMIAPPPTPDIPPPDINVPPGLPPTSTPSSGKELTRRALTGTPPSRRVVQGISKTPTLPPKKLKKDTLKTPETNPKLSEWVNRVATRYSCTVASAFFAFGVHSSIVRSIREKFGARPSSRHRHKFPESEAARIVSLHARPPLPISSSIEDAVRRLPLTPRIKLCAFPSLTSEEVVELKPHISNDIPSRHEMYVFDFCASHALYFFIHSLSLYLSLYLSIYLA